MNDRDPHLQAVLEKAVAPVDDPGDWDQVIGRASAEPTRRRWMWRLLPAIGVATLVAALAILLVETTTDAGRVAPAAPRTGELSPALVARGQTLFGESGCLSCHTVGGTGADGPGPDLTSQATRGRGVEWQLQHLRDPRSLVPNSAMPPYTDLSDDDLLAIGHYVESLGLSADPAQAFRLFDRPASEDEVALAAQHSDLRSELRIPIRLFGQDIVAGREADGTICLGRSVAGQLEPWSCSSPERIAETGAAQLVWAPAPDRPQVRLVLVPDSVADARIGDVPLEVENNVVVVTDGTTGAIEVRDQSGWRPLFLARAASTEVLVVNGSGLPGSGGDLTRLLQASGWTTLPPVNATRSQDTSFVAAVTTDQGVVDQLAMGLGTDSDSADGLDLPPDTTADVVVVLGADWLQPSS